jgi:CRISPR-associated protein Cas1
MLSEKLQEVPALWAGWQKVRTNNGGAGGDGIGMTQFERTAVQRIERLSQALKLGRYRPGPYRMVAIPKKRGGERVLAIPCITDRVVQSAAAQLLGPVLEPTFERASFAYRPGRGVTHAVQAVLRYRRQGYTWTAEGDIARCFDEIPHDPLLAVLEERTGDAALVDLIGLWLETYAPSGIGIPQGSPISPLLCNLHLDAVDEAIDGAGVRLVRYADDFVILAKNEGRARASLETIAAVLRMQGLALNPDKSRIVPSDHALRFLGHVFVRQMAWKEISENDEDAVPPVPDAPPEEMLAQWSEKIASEADALPATEVRPSRRRTLYLVEPGSLLSIRNDAFLALGPKEPDGKGEMQRSRRFIEHASRIDRIEIGPGAHADWRAQKLAAAYGVPLAMVDGYGTTLAWMTGPGCLRAKRIAAQARFLANEMSLQSLAAAFARGRIRNQRIMLRRLNRSRKSPDIAAAAVALRRREKRLPEMAAREVISGHEGHAAAHYWPAYAAAIGNAFDFDHLQWRRRRRPPPDAVNACLGYLSALLERDVCVAIERAGLHPGMGALHAEQDAGDALVYDLMEAFRAPIIETLVTTMIGRRQLRSEMFLIRERVSNDEGVMFECRMELEARRALIQTYESWLARPIKSRRSGKMIAWRALFEEEARALGNLFDGSVAEFVPYQMDF